MDWLAAFTTFLHDMPGQLTLLANSMGPWLYVLLALIIFAETGFVITPFLPGDSLLFAVGAVVALPDSQLSFGVMVFVLIVSAILGDGVNYSFGYWLGPKLFRNRYSKILNPQHLKRTQDFYNRHGGKTIILARFIPIVRTYAPFVAGLGKMQYRQFALFNVIGAIIWISLFLSLGFFFGHLPQVKANFQLVILAIIVISVLPIVFEFVKARRGTESKA